MTPRGHVRSMGCAAPPNTLHSNCFRNESQIQRSSLSFWTPHPTARMRPTTTKNTNLFYRAPMREATTYRAGKSQAPANVICEDGSYIAHSPNRHSVTSPAVLPAHGLDLVQLFVQVAQPQHGALRDKEHPGLRVSLLQEHLGDGERRQNGTEHWSSTRKKRNYTPRPPRITSLQQPDDFGYLPPWTPLPLSPTLNTVVPSRNPGKQTQGFHSIHAGCHDTWKSCCTSTSGVCRHVGSVCANFFVFAFSW